MNGAIAGWGLANKHLEKETPLLYINTDQETYIYVKGVPVGKSLGTVAREIHPL